MAKHPYYPLKLKLDGYHPMVLTMDYILAVFGGSMAIVALSTWLLSGMPSPYRSHHYNSILFISMI